MAEIHEDTVRALITSVNNPVFVVIPGEGMEDEDMVKLFKSLEMILTKIEDKSGFEFDILVDTATYFGGYDVMADGATDQRNEAEAEAEEFHEEIVSDEEDSENDEVGNTSQD